MPSTSGGDPLFTPLQVLDGAAASRVDSGDGEASVAQELGCFLVPHGYEIWADGLYHVEPTMPAQLARIQPNIRRGCPKERRQHLKIVARRPLWISAQGKTIDTGEELIRLAYLPTDPSDAPRHQWVARQQIAERRELVRLAKIGLPARTGNADRIEEYLDRAWHVNAGRLPRSAVAARSGAYHVGGEGWPQDTPSGWGWLIGRTWIGPPCTVVEMDPREGHTTIEGLGTSGDRGAWLDMFQKITRKNPFCRWLLFSVLAAPLLRFLRHRTFIVHHYSHTGAGKSSILKLGMSAVGNPSLLTATFNRTELSFTEIFKYMSDLPIAFDELQSSKNVKHGSIIHDLCLERGRGRAGDGGGLKPEIAGWRTVARTTGEEPIVGSGKVDLGGESSRVLQLNVKALEPREAEDVHRWLETERSWGWGGQILLEGLRDLLALSDGEARLVKAHASIRDEIEGQAGCGYVRAAALACIATATMICSQLFWGTERERARREAISDAVVVARAMIEIDEPEAAKLPGERALQCFRDHRESNRKLWIDVSKSEGAYALTNRTYPGLFGIERAGDNHDEVWLIQTEANKLLQKAELPPGRIWGDLQKANILIRGTDRPAATRQLGNFRNRVYVLRQSAFDLGDLDTDVDVDPGKPKAQ